MDSSIKEEVMQEKPFPVIALIIAALLTLWVLWPLLTAKLPYKKELSESVQPFGESGLECPEGYFLSIDENDNWLCYPAA